MQVAQSHPSGSVYNILTGNPVIAGSSQQYELRENVKFVIPGVQSFSIIVVSVPELEVPSLHVISKHTSSAFSPTGLIARRMKSHVTSDVTTCTSGKQTSHGNKSTVGSNKDGINGTRSYSLKAKDNSGEIAGARSSSTKFACKVGHSVTPLKFVPINSISNSLGRA